MRSIYIVVGLREPDFAWECLDAIDDYCVEDGEPGWLEDRVKHHRDTGDFMNVQVAKLQFDGSVEAGCEPATGCSTAAGVEACEWVGLIWPDGGHRPDHSLLRHNDTDRWTFDQIADFIASDPPGLFHPIPDSEQES